MPVPVPEPPADPRPGTGLATAGGGRLHLVALDVHGDERGLLSVTEAGGGLSFTARRLFFVWGVPPGTTRGGHAHRTSAQLLVCASGRVRVLADDGAESLDVVLDSPATGLYIGPMVWNVQLDHTPDAVLAVVASEPFDRAGYIDDPDQWRREVSGR